MLAFRAKHPGTLALACDVTDPAAQSTLMGYVAGRFGRPDLLVNNAGR
jgi:NAD(P)-dependent dehydrogenase (short-subunit alcohol dehydrogenase family)